MSTLETALAITGTLIAIVALVVPFVVQQLLHSRDVTIAQMQGELSSLHRLVESFAIALVNHQEPRA